MAKGVIMPPEPEYISIIEVAQHYQVPVKTVKDWEKQGLLPCYRSGKRGERMFKRCEVRAFIYQGVYKEGEKHE